MLEAMTYKKELIISIFMLNERDQLWADQVTARSLVTTQKQHN